MNPRGLNVERDTKQVSKTEWPRVLAALRSRTRPQQFDTWFAPLAVRQLNETLLEIAAPNRFYCDWLRNNYLGLIQEALLQTFGVSPSIRFVEDPAAARSPASSPAGLPAAEPPAGARVGPQLPSFVPSYTFDNFVVGASNRLAHAAALAVVESPGKAYNPLFMHGAVGLGKTHLQQAICQALLVRNPQTKLRYLTCESFMNEFISSIQHGSMELFREKYRQSDIIVIDDVHFLAKGESTQEEFFHTFNALYNAHKQIILSSDRPPEEIRSIEERLVSRFKWGLVCRIDPPEFETRVAIVKRKAKLLDRDLPEDVINLIATTVDSNIRELEGAINRVIGLARLANRPIDFRLGQEALKDLSRPRRPLGIEQIMQHVADAFNVKITDLQSKRKSKSLAFPRQICMHLARKLTTHSLEEIGGYFGGRDHTTVLYADEKIRSLSEKDPDLCATLSRIISDLQKL
jgi:chromosomal replication initiator protein